MFTLSSPSLPTNVEDQQYPGGLLTAIAPSTYPGGLLVTVDYGAADPPTATTGRSPAVEQNTGAIASGTYTISNAVLVTIYRAISAGGLVWVPAVDVGDPKPGEFVFSGSSVVLHTGGDYAIADGESIELIGANLSQSVSTAIARIPSFLTQIPVTQIEWGCSLEGHPSGSLSLSVNGLAQRDAVLAALAPGTEITIEGIGLRTGQASIEQSAIADFPYGKFTISIPLEGKWQNYVDEPFTLRSLGVDSDTLSATPGECTNADGTTANEAIQSNYTLTEIAAGVGAIYEGPEVRVPVPSDAQAGEFTTFDAEFQDRLRINGAIADYSQSSAICMKPIDAGRMWDYRGAILLNKTISQQQGRIESPQQFNRSSALLPPAFSQAVTGAIASLPTFTQREETGGLAIEWENYQLSGRFSEATETDDLEETLSEASGRDRWIRLQRETEEFEEGDPIPTSPPDGAVALKSVSLNYDVSGPTKVLSKTRKLDGLTDLVEQWRYGYTFRAIDIKVGNELQGSPAAWWEIVEYTRTEYLFDSETGYALGYNRTGYRRSRFKVETEETPETLTLDPGDPSYSLYQFQNIPINERERYQLKQHRDFYKSNNEGASARGQLERYCLADGTVSYRYRRNRNFVEPMFKSATSREHSSFAWAGNPDSTDEETLPLLITGKEEASRSTLEIQPGKLRRQRFGANSQEQPGDRDPDRYTDYSNLFTAQDPGFSNSLELSNFKDFEGRPGVADKLPPLYEQEVEPPEGNNGNGDADDQGDRLYLLNTSTTPPDYLGNTISYQWALTLDQAILAAETDAYLEQLENGDRESIAIPWNPEIRPGDRFIYEQMGEVRRRFVLAVRWKPQLLGKTEDGHRATGYTELQLARDVKPTIYQTVIDLPGADEASNDDDRAIAFGGVNRKGFTLGEILPAATISRTKGNYG